MKSNRFLIALASTSLVSAALCVSSAAQGSESMQDGRVPIIFVHGNGDDASRWVPIIWLFESNGYPADRLGAIRFHNPVARTDDMRDEPGRSSTAQAMQELSSFVQDTLRRTHASKVVLVGSSRGGLTIRNYVQNGGGKDLVSAEILCGTPNHGVNVSTANHGGEFNGQGNFLSSLNERNEQNTEVTPGVRTLTLRSDNLDKYAQPTGVAFGRPETATGVTFEGPALAGAENLILPGNDHRELAFSDTSFAAMYRFITGAAPKTLQIKSERKLAISGLVTGLLGAVSTNDAMSGVHLRVSEIQQQGHGQVVYEKTTDSSGTWGPVRTFGKVELSFDLEFEGRHVVYFLPTLLRSTTLLNFRWLPVPALAPGAPSGPSATQSGGSFVVLRPDGYFSRKRDPVLVDGVQASTEPEGLPLKDSFVVPTASTYHPVEVVLRKEKILVEPSQDQQRSLSIAEFLR